ncbi:MAG: pseudouridine synthase [Granulosicoccaceae bacterium]
MGQRLQKLMASAGLGSRRGLEALIADGKVSVNGQLAKLGDQAGDGDQVTLEGIHYRVLASDRGPRTRVILYHKPVGQVCSRKAEREEDSVFAHLPRVQGARWVSVGRLDVNTSGLLLFTDDGELANRLMHPSFEVQRKYAVRIRGQVDRDMMQRLLDGVELEDGPASFETLDEAGGEGSNHWFHVTLREGRNREVRRLWESQGVEVSRLIRLQYGPVSLPRGLGRGRHRFLDGDDLRDFLKALGYKASGDDLTLVKQKPPRRPQKPQAKRRRN